MTVTEPPVLRFDVISIFGEYLAPLRLSLLGRAEAAGMVRFTVHDLRDVTSDIHRSVDDAPYGGGAGMLMTPQPWLDAVDRVVATGRAHLGADATPVVLVPSPAGFVFTQAAARDLSTAGWLVILCGRYEGIDERVIDELADRFDVRPVSIGDYVLAGGEAAALVMIEAVTRLVPGVLGNTASIVEESHAGHLLEYPAYTRPAVWRGRAVPDVLTSGDHARVARWRRDQALRRTAERRPDLLRRTSLDDLDTADVILLHSLGWRLGEDGPEPG